MNQTIKGLLLLLAVTFALVLSGQESPYTEVKVVKNTQWTYDYEGVLSQITDPMNPDLGTLENVSLGNGNRRLEFTPHPDVLGSDKVIIRYQTGSWPFLENKFLAFDIEVVPSVVIPRKDYTGMMMNQADHLILPLENDSTSAGALSLDAIALVNNGTATIQGDSALLFTPDSDFAGMAYINYITCDSVGTCASGQVTVCVMDYNSSPQSDTVSYSTSKNTPVTVLMPGSNYELAIEPDNGVVDSTGADAVVYTPNEDYSGLDTFVMMNADSVTRTVVVDVIYVPDQNGFALDDYVYTTVNDTVSFNVFENDLTDDFSIENFSNPDGSLTYEDDGDFTYIPPVDFEGLIKFQYTVCDLFNITCETAEVYIYIDNQSPINDETYRIVTPKNTPVILNYDVPVLGYDFNLTQHPTDGWLGYYPGEQYVYIGCHEVYGYNQVVYDPAEDFLGTDAFQIEYCVSTADTCQVIDIEILVLDIAVDTSCPCVENCVWPGDANSDGKVNVRDLLPIGYNMGLTGPSRSEADSEEWYGQYCQDWQEELADGTNIKHADTDGDGILMSSDTSEILEHYYSVHTVVPEDDDHIKAYPIQLIIDDPNVSEGDWATIYIKTGTEQYPLIDYMGLTFSIDYSTDVVVDSTMQCTFIEDSWLRENAACLSLGVSPYEGRLEAGISRTDGIAVTGEGIIARLDFIVGEEDIGGFGSEELKTNTLEVTISEIMGMQGNGSPVLLPGSSLSLNIQEKQEDTDVNPSESISPEDIILYPNPAVDQYTVHINGLNNYFSKIELLDQQGKVIRISEGSKRKQEQFMTAGIPSGFYFVRIHAADQIITKKLVIQ